MKINTLWLIIESIILIIFTMYSIQLFWIYTTYYIQIKVILTFLILLVIYDIFKGYIYTKWIIIQNTEEIK